MRRIKKTIIAIFVFVLVFTLSSCTYINTLIDIATKNKMPNTEIKVNYYVDDNLYLSETTEKRKNFEYPESPTMDGYNFGGWTYKDSYQTLAPEDFLYDEAQEIDLYAYFSKGYHFSDNIKYNGPEIVKAVMPSFGSPNILVVPLTLGGNHTKSMIEEIKTAFTGTSEETGYESVNSFYYKSSRGRLNIQFDFIEDWFTPAYKKSYYEKYDSTKDRYSDYGTGLIYNEFLKAYDEVIDFSKYDNDGDGFIDGVWFIYDVMPDYFKEERTWWAYVTSTYNTSRKYDGCYPRNYANASYYFMHEYETEKKYGIKLEKYDMSDIKIDSHTYIHETGHLLGLDDYYDSDTSKGGTGGLYGAGMMDANCGDLNTVDKLLLGFIDPYVITPAEGSTQTIEIGSFQETGDVVLIAKKTPKSIYSEYFLVELYTITGLNEHDVPITRPMTLIPFNLTYGIRILHVNASLTKEYNGKTYSFPVDFTYNNSTTKALFVDTLINYKSGINRDMETNTEYLDTRALFYEVGTEYNLKNSSFKMTNGSNLFFNFTIDSISNEKAKLTFALEGGIL